MWSSVSGLPCMWVHSPSGPGASLIQMWVSPLARERAVYLEQVKEEGKSLLEPLQTGGAVHLEGQPESLRFQPPPGWEGVINQSDDFKAKLPIQAAVRKPGLIWQHFLQRVMKQ